MEDEWGNFSLRLSPFDTGMGEGEVDDASIP